MDVTARSEQVDALDAFIRRAFGDDVEALSDFGCTRRYQLARTPLGRIFEVALVILHFFFLFIRCCFFVVT